MGHDKLKYGGEFQVNTYNQSWQASPCVSAVTNDKFLVCWYSNNQDGWDSGVYGQIFNSNGSRYGEEFQINTYIKSSQNNPSTGSLSNGKFVVCWESWNQDGSSAGIYAQMFNNNGTKYGLEFKVNTYTNNWQWAPCICSLDNGKFVICWESGDQNGIYGQIFNNDGSMAGDEYRVNSNKHYYHSNPSISNLNDGKFVVCWHSLPEDDSGLDIYGQILYNNGSKYGEEFLINTYTESDQFLGDVSSLTNGKFIVCWYGDYQEGSGWEILGKYYINGLIHPLQPFLLIEPSNDITLKATNPMFQWNHATSIRINLPWELEYHI